MAFGNIAESDWCFEHIRAVDEVRAARLEAAGPPDALAHELRCALCKAIERRDFRVAVDSKDNTFVEQRAIVQFRVAQEIYDWFFNARTGYRAQFWLGPCVGIAFNKMSVEWLSGVLQRRLPQTVRVGRINVVVANESRDESYDGVRVVPREMIMGSLVSDESKIWIAERRYDESEIVNIGFAVLSTAERCLRKLCVPRWTANPSECVTGEGLRAPYPEDDQSWLDLKGGFVSTKGKASQIKPQTERAEKIHRHGWT